MSVTESAAQAQKPKLTAKKSSFYLAMRVLEPPRRDAMFAIYAFCRAVDDIADEEGDRDERRRRLTEWRRDLDELYAGRTRLRCAQLAEPVRRFGLERADFEAVIDGMEMDVDQDIRAPDWATLDRYCDNVASAVGRLSIRAFGLVDESTPPGKLPEDARLLAHHLGRALQLTNILRDLDEDASIGRLYLPREDLCAAGISEIAEPGEVLANPALTQACAPTIARATEHFDEAARIMAQCPRASVCAPRIMADVYRAILVSLERRGFAPPRQRIRTPRHRVLLAILRYGLF